jgi:deoxyribodipyrimidine photo-lyase
MASCGQVNGGVQLVTPYAPVGPVRDRLDRLAMELAAEGITLTRMLRSWDAHAWPHTSRGFFSFRERIPALVREQQLGLQP